LKKKKSPYSVKLIWQLIKHGLILQGIRYAFAKIGLDIMPYYWVKEEESLSNKPLIKADSQDYIFISLNSEDIKSILDKSDSINEKKILQSLDYKQECVGLKYGNQIAAYMFVELNDFIFKNRVFKIKENEAYLLNMFTFNSFRGKSLAPYLRYCSYRYLENRNITINLREIVKHMPKKSHPMDVARTVVSVMGLEDKETNSNSPAANMRKAIRIFAKTPTAIAAFFRARKDKNVIPPKKKLSFSENFFYMCPYFLISLLLQEAYFLPDFQMTF